MKAASLWLPLACIAGVAVLLAGGTFGYWPIPFGLNWHFDRCETDDEVDAAQRASYEDAALDFVRKIVGSTPEQAYAGATDAFKKQNPTETFLKFAQASIRPLGEIQDWRVSHSYYLTGVTIGQGGARPLVCTAVAHGSSSQPEGRVLVAHNDASQQAHVILEGAAKGTAWAFTVWLVRESGKWHVHGFYATPSGVAGKTAEAMWHEATSQHGAGRDFNAFILYATALQLSSRGPDLHLGIQSEIKKDLDAIPRPSELEREAPYRWRFEGATAPVLKVGPVPVNGKMYLLLTQELDPWPDDQGADRQNHALIEAFSRLHPEYKNAFDGLVVDAVARGGRRGLRTVAESLSASP
jgi:hypothetical protein